MLRSIQGAERAPTNTLVSPQEPCRGGPSALERTLALLHLPCTTGQRPSGQDRSASTATLGCRLGELAGRLFSLGRPAVLGLMLASCAGMPLGKELTPDIVPQIYGPEVVVSDQGRSLLQFGVLTRNLGEGPLDIRTVDEGSGPRSIQLVYRNHAPAEHRPLAVKNVIPQEPVHRRYHLQVRDVGKPIPPHFENFGKYGLLDAQGAPVQLPLAEGQARVPGEANLFKQDWAITDSGCDLGSSAFEGWALPLRAEIDQDHVSAGCYDDYPAGLQYLDVTGLRPGDYEIIFTSNPAADVYESRADNNVARMKIRLVPTMDGMRVEER